MSKADVIEIEVDNPCYRQLLILIHLTVADPAFKRIHDFSCVINSFPVIISYSLRNHNCFLSVRPDFI